MKISELIARLESEKAAHGDIPVVVNNPAGDSDDATDVIYIDGCGTPKKPHIVIV